MDRPDLSKPWVYWLSLAEPAPPESGLTGEAFRVCVVVEGEAGYYPMGDGRRLQTPWYWDEALCARRNAERGYSPERVMEVVSSSMAAGRVDERRVRMRDVCG